MRRNIIPAVLILAAVVQSCILEDRSGCPSYLTLDFSETPDSVSHIHLIIKQVNGRLLSDTLYRRDFDSVYEIPVMRGRTEIAAFGNIKSMQYDGGYRTTTGNAADNLYTCFFPAVYESDLSSDTVTLHKSCIGLYIKVIGDIVDRTYTVIESSSVGYSLSGGILEGQFRHIPEPEPSQANQDRPAREYRSRVTRQKNPDLTLAVHADNGKCIKRLNLSAILDENGIYMCDPELEDLYISVDIDRALLTISPEDWTDTGLIEITI